MARVHKMDQPLTVEDLESYSGLDGSPRARKVRRETTRRARFLELMREGVFLSTAAALVGLGESTVREWRSKGEKARSGRFKDFADDVNEARADGELRRQRAVTAVAVNEGDARTLLKMMQICYPHWRIPKELDVKVTGDGSPVGVVLQVAGMTTEQLDALAGVDLDDLGGLRLPTDGRPTTPEPEEPTDG